MSLMAEYGQYPAEYRAAVMREKKSVAAVARMEAEADLREWAKAAKADAERRIAATKLGTPAEESRRLRDELRVSRLIDNARATGSAKSAAADLAARAMSLYGTNEDEAYVYAQAASELGDRELSAEVIGMVTHSRNLADPDKAKAMHDLHDVDVVTAAFVRDIDGAYAAALAEGQKLARAVGDDHSAAQMRREASDAKRNSTVAAWDAAKESGEKFSQPVGDGTITPSEMFALERGANPRIARQDEFEHALDSKGGDA